jgi:hypothetical protein
MYQRGPHDQYDGHDVDSLSWAGSSLWLFPSLKPPHARDQAESDGILYSTSDSSSSSDGNVEAESPQKSPEPASNIDSQRSDPTLGSTDGPDSPETMLEWGSQVFSSTTDTDNELQHSDTMFSFGEAYGEIPPLFFEPQSRFASPEPIKAETAKQEEDEKDSFQCNTCYRSFNSAKAVRYAQHAVICL